MPTPPRHDPLMIDGKPYYTLINYDPVSIEVTILTVRLMSFWTRLPRRQAVRRRVSTTRSGSPRSSTAQRSRTSTTP